MGNIQLLIGYKHYTRFHLLLQDIQLGKKLSLDPKQLGERIRLAREARGLSQEQLAELIARDQRSVSEYENGKRRIYAHDLPTIAQALEIPLVYLFQDALSNDDLDIAMLEEFHRLDRNARETVLEMVRLLTNLTTKRN
jgi:transcriptional regulator with XRE-family HTH domain